MFGKLEILAKAPFDLTYGLTPERIEKMTASGVGFKLFYGTERVNDEIMHALFELAKRADVLQKMAEMQKGEIVNVSENRAALHTAMRDFFHEPMAKEATRLAEKEIEKLEKFLAKIGESFTDIVQIGIGGSDLGPRALAIAADAFRRPGRQAHFISNVDPDDANRILAKLDLKKTLFVVVSKSGTTLETLTNEEFVRARYRKVGIDPKNHFVAVTGEKSPMDNPAKYMASFYIWDYVGGRYSATSMVGGVVLSFLLGVNGFKEILRGASEMDRHALKEKNLPLISALLGIWNRNFLKLPTVAIVPYSQALVRFSAHLQQLDMESNGKRIDKKGKEVHFQTGPVIWGEPGTNGQHSFYQLIHQGTEIVPMEFIGFCHAQREGDLELNGTTSQEKLLSNLFAQSIALAAGQKNENPNKVFPGNRPNRILLAKRLDLFTLGALLSFYEHKVVYQGLLWNINSFDQEGVQLGKKLASQILHLFEGKMEDFALGEAYIRQLRRFESEK